MDVVPEREGLAVSVRRNGASVAVRYSAAAAGRELELSLDRFDLFDPDEPARDRVFKAFTAGLGRNGKDAGDATRRVLLRL